MLVTIKVLQYDGSIRKRHGAGARALYSAEGHFPLHGGWAESPERIFRMVLMIYRPN